jgi:hypothetical protein
MGFDINGAFLVRASGVSDLLTLSLCHHGKIIHYRLTVRLVLSLSVLSLSWIPCGVWYCGCADTVW